MGLVSTFISPHLSWSNGLVSIGLWIWATTIHLLKAILFWDPHKGAHHAKLVLHVMCLIVHVIVFIYLFSKQHTSLSAWRRGTLKWKVCECNAACSQWRCEVEFTFMLNLIGYVFPFNSCTCLSLQVLALWLSSYLRARPFWAPLYPVWSSRGFHR